MVHLYVSDDSISDCIRQFEQTNINSGEQLERLHDSENK